MDEFQNSTDHIPAEDRVDTDSALGLNVSDRIFLVVIVLVCVGALVVKQLPRWFSAGETIQVLRSDQHSALFQIDINSATWVEWMQLDGIGEMTARKIVADRNENGPFQSVAEVTRVKGIGAVTLGKMEPHLRCDNCSSAIVKPR